MINNNKRQEKVEQVKTLISEGTTDPKIIATKTGLSINRVYEIRKTLGYSKRALKAQKNPSQNNKPKTPPTNNSEPEKPQNEPETTSEPVHEPETIKADEPMKAHIPVKNGFHPYIPRKLGKTTDYKLIEELYEQRRPTLLIGETGCGKTHLARHLAFIKKVPYERVNFDGSMTPDKLIGHWTPNPQGGFQWQDGLLTKFVRAGGVIVIDEINSGNADLLFFMHGLLDDEKKIILTEKDGEVIHAHPDFWFCATMNPDYEGTKPLNLALQDRFVIIEIDYDEKVEKQLVSNEKLINLAGRLRKLYREGEITTPTSTRTLMFYEADVKTFGEETSQILLLNKYRPEERSAIREVIDLELNGKKPITVKKEGETQ
jgi:thioredoxin-related protein